MKADQVHCIYKPRKDTASAKSIPKLLFQLLSCLEKAHQVLWFSPNCPRDPIKRMMIRKILLHQDFCDSRAALGMSGKLLGTLFRSA